QPAMIRLRVDDQWPRLKLANDIETGRVAVIHQRVALAVKEGVHIRNRVDAIATGPGSGGFTDAVDALVADPARFHERLLDLKPVEQSRPHLIRTPNRNAFALPQHLLDGRVEREVDAWFDAEVPRPDVEGRGHPADGMLLDRGSPRPIAPSHFDYRGP